jgi:hypothetical protein
LLKPEKVEIQHGRCNGELHQLLKPEKVEIFNYVTEELTKNFAYGSFCFCTLEAVPSYLPLEAAKN